MATQTELAQLQGEHHAKVLEAQKLQRGLDRKEQELADMQQAKDQLEVELEDLQQQKKKGDKALNVRQWLSSKSIQIKLYCCHPNKAVRHFISPFCYLLSVTLQISDFV